MSERVYEHAASLYAYLKKHSKNGVYEGTKTDAFRELGISQTHYSIIWKSLHELGCIETLSVGGHGRQSRIKLFHAPDPGGFAIVYDKVLTLPTRYDTLEQQIKDLARRLPSSDINKLLIDFDTRLRAVEEKLAAHKAPKSRG